jgi:hypothetical protein
MIREAIEFLAELATKAKTPPLVYEDAYDRAFVINGEIVEKGKSSVPRSHHPRCLDDLIALANRFKEATQHYEPAVWYGECAVVAVLDDHDTRLNNATFTLHRSAAFLTLESLAKSKAWHEQKDFIRLLRIDLAGTLDSVHLLERVRKVKFENGATTTGSVQRDRESLGREITSRVEADGDLPEEVTLMLPTFMDMGEREPRPLRCSVEVDSARGMFRLLPFPDTLDVLLQEAVASIGARLIGGLSSEIPCYYGTP